MIRTQNFGRLYVQTTAQNDELRVRKRKSEPYKTEPRGERYYQIASHLPSELVPPRVGPQAIRTLQKSVERVRAQTESLNKQLSQYTDLADDRYACILDNCDAERIYDADQIERKVQSDPYLTLWTSKRQACKALSDRKSDVLDGMEHELTASLVHQAINGAGRA